nr:MAG TPA: hypothetical protein [Caudoviricetes sp.]
MKAVLNNLLFNNLNKKHTACPNAGCELVKAWKPIKTHRSRRCVSQIKWCVS